ncbi:alpha-amylase, partial [Kouleothrix aurantiaca]
MYRSRNLGWFNLLALAGLLLGALALPIRVPVALAAGPSSVTIAGDLQSELGCSGNWQADCAATHLTTDAVDDVWQGTWTVPAGNWQYKAALNDAWTESYGLHAGSDNIALNLGASTSVKFYYDNKTHWITDNKNSVIAVVAGSFQSELGCIKDALPADWQPDCLRSWLQDVDGDGTYTFETTALPAGTYEGKVALNENWDVNYGQGGTPGGANIAFTVPVNNAKVSFSYNATSHVLTILAGHAADNNVEWDGLRHDSRDTLYRTPGGAVPAGTPVTLRFRTFHNDATSVKLRLYDLNAGAQSVVPMSIAASNVSCFQAGLESERCDFWAATLPNGTPNNYWYRFIVSDGTKTAYYADNTSALDGGLGAPS